MKKIVCLLALVAAPGCSASAETQGPTFTKEESVGRTRNALRRANGRNHARKAKGIVAAFADGFAFADIRTADLEAQFCTEREVPIGGGASCAVTHCNLTPGATVPAPVSVGAIGIQGGNLPLTLNPLPDGTYETYFDPTAPLWNGGESITMSTGVQVPVRHNALVAPPAGVALTSNIESVRPRTENLVLDWSFPNISHADKVKFQVFLPSVNQVEVVPDFFFAPDVVTCDFSLADGHGVIPASVLGELPTGEYYFDVQADSYDNEGPGLIRFLGALAEGGPETITFQ